MPLHKDDPRSLGGYRIVDRLGAGGMGVVYRATSRSGREVAVKVVHAQYVEDPVFRTRFRQEIEAVRKVSGAFTAPVVDADPDAVRPWMATQYVAAPSLAERIKADGPLRGAELRRLALGLVEALRDIHRAGVVHRDLKPGNVLMAEDGPRVIDFGISRVTENQTLTETGHMIGTPPFMSPEQLTDARSVGPATDVFSLGALLTYAATGRGPFDADSPYLTAYRVMNEEPALEHLPPSLRAIVVRCLAKSAGERPTLDELLKEFAVILPEERSAPGDTATVALRRPVPEASRAPVAVPSAGRRGRLLALTGVTGVLAVALAVYLVLGSLESRGTADAGRSSTAAASRWAAVPAGWKPWSTTVREDAESGVIHAPESPGDTGTPSCALNADAVYCAGGGVPPVRLDALTGRTLWRADTAPYGKEAGGYEGWILGAHDGVVLVRQSVLLGSGDGRTPSVVALDADTGRQLWSRPVTAENGAPGLAGGLALIQDADGRTVTARSLLDGARRWSAPLPADHSCVFEGSGAALYALCSRYDGDSPGVRLISVDPADGTTRPLATLAPHSVHLGALDDSLVFVEQNKASLESSSDDPAYARVVLVDRASGARRTVPLAGDPAGQAALVGGVLCFAASNGLVTAVSPTTGKRLWQTRTTLERPGQPMADPRGTAVFLASVTGRVAALDTREGTVLWESLPRASRAVSNGWTPAMFRQAGALVVITPDGTVFSVDPAHPHSTPAPA
ncbi:serine/threonine-protein kinase [Streptomyces aurantiogriseus]|uniref:Serine/threonine protein kinase n=1 Tax=Streptomyces aurantiogriseus TaxID=66870 RepID=A0A918F8Z5_9ACTN|nr:serine/threonine-protein kinase [Streptomyces aurantiogriseus]GGR20552.1 serine/threonine protein kinase [Streptomyces aurantiogriseus]